MLLAIDLDNTIVSYEAVLAELAHSAGVPATAIASGKAGVRDYFRSARIEDQWTRLQGVMYGPAMGAAVPYPGVLDCLEQASGSGFRIAVVSHRSRRPYSGPGYDLHKAARDWLDRHLPAGTLAAAYLEESRPAKLSRIVTLSPKVWIDDLADLLLELDATTTVSRWLFDPLGREPQWAPSLKVMRSWHDISGALMAVLR